MRNCEEEIEDCYGNSPSTTTSSSALPSKSKADSTRSEDNVSKEAEKDKTKECVIDIVDEDDDEGDGNARDVDVVIEDTAAYEDDEIEYVCRVVRGPGVALSSATIIPPSRRRERERANTSSSTNNVQDQGAGDTVDETPKDNLNSSDDILGNENNNNNNSPLQSQSHSPHGSDNNGETRRASTDEHLSRTPVDTFIPADSEQPSTSSEEKVDEEQKVYIDNDNSAMEVNLPVNVPVNVKLEGEPLFSYNPKSGISVAQIRRHRSVDANESEVKQEGTDRSRIKSGSRSRSRSLHRHRRPRSHSSRRRTPNQSDDDIRYRRRNKSFQDQSHRRHHSPPDRRSRSHFKVENERSRSHHRDENNRRSRSRSRHSDDDDHNNRKSRSRYRDNQTGGNRSYHRDDQTNTSHHRDGHRHHYSSRDVTSQYAPYKRSPAALLSWILNCPRCKKRFVTRDAAVKHHKEAHHKKFCPVCFYTFSCKGNTWKDHLINYHQVGIDDEKVKCCFCDSEHSFGGIYNHIGRMHLVPAELGIVHGRSSGNPNAHAHASRNASNPNLHREWTSAKTSTSQSSSSFRSHATITENRSNLPSISRLGSSFTGEQFRRPFRFGHPHLSNLRSPHPTDRSNTHKPPPSGSSTRSSGDNISQQAPRPTGSATFVTSTATAATTTVSGSRPLSFYEYQKLAVYFQENPRVPMNDLRQISEKTGIAPHLIVEFIDKVREESGRREQEPQTT